MIQDNILKYLEIKQDLLNIIESLKNEKEKAINQIESQIESVNQQISEGTDGIKIFDIVECFDFDCDGIVSICDIFIPLAISILYREETMAHDTRYNELELTYNGKSIDISNDGTMDKLDYMQTMNMISILTENFGISFDNYGLTYEEIVEFMIEYHKDHEHFPSFDIFKEYAKLYN